MAKPKSRSYDTSKYISFPMALTAASVVLVLLVLIGLKYSVFTGGLLSAKLPDPTKIAGYCKDIYDAQKTLAWQWYTNCKIEANKAKASCLKAYPPSDPYGPAQCEAMKQSFLAFCDTNYNTMLSYYESEYKKCSIPTPTTQPMGQILQPTPFSR